MLLLNIAELLSGGVADELCASRFKETKIGLGQMTKELQKGGSWCRGCFTYVTKRSSLST